MVRLFSERPPDMKPAKSGVSQQQYEALGGSTELVT